VKVIFLLSYVHFYNSVVVDTSHFAFTPAYSRSFYLLEIVSTVNIFSSANYVRPILLRVIRFFRRMRRVSSISLLLSASELHGVYPLPAN